MDPHRHGRTSRPPSTFLMRCARQGVDNSDKRGHDEADGWTHIVMAGTKPGHDGGERGVTATDPLFLVSQGHCAGRVPMAE